MKIRSGHVSNSSSASFIIKFSSDVDKVDIEKYIRKSAYYLDKYWEDGKTFPYGIYLKEDGEHYTYETDTTMFNDWYDIDVTHFVRALTEQKIDGLGLISILQTYDEHSECSKLVSYDPKCWEQEWADDEGKNATEKDLKEARVRQEMIDGEYVKYLLSIGCELNDEETFIAANSILLKNR